MNTKPSLRVLPFCTVLAAALTLAACGGGGGGSSTNASTEQPASAAVTPMTTLVVPDSMTWSTANTKTLNVSVLDASGQPVLDAGVTLSTVMRSNPHDETPLARPVPLDRIDQASTGPNGQAELAARVPAHLSEVIVEASKGDLSVRKVVAVADLTAPLTLKFE